MVIVPGMHIPLPRRYALASLKYGVVLSAAVVVSRANWIGVSAVAGSSIKWRMYLTHAESSDWRRPSYSALMARVLKSAAKVGSF